MLNKLTRFSFGVSIPAPLPHAAVGICSPYKGHKRPLSNVVFLYPSKTQACYLRRCLSVLAGWIGQALKSLAGSFAGTANPIQSAAKYFAVFRGGLSLFKGIKPMSQHTHTQKPANAVSRSPLFNCYHYRRLIAQGLTGNAATRFKRRYPAITVKFSHMEVSV
jgi:hypothetical protein